MSENDPKLPPRFEFLIGLFLCFLPWGLSLLGVSTNFLLGSLILLIAFGVLMHVVWQSLKFRGLPAIWRTIAIVLSGGLFVALIVMLKPQDGRDYQTSKNGQTPSSASTSPSLPPATSTSSPQPTKSDSDAPQTNSGRISKRDAEAITLKRARALYQAGQYRSALIACDKLLQSDPHNPEAKELKALIIEHEKILNPH